MNDFIIKKCPECNHKRPMWNVKNGVLVCKKCSLG